MALISSAGNPNVLLRFFVFPTEATTEGPQDIAERTVAALQHAFVAANQSTAAARAAQLPAGRRPALRLRLDLSHSYTHWGERKQRVCVCF
jgi:hypothetical protein